ncbi:MAG TPA: agmatinase [Hyphomicrobiales bacterium]|nr:agmatinase [Hyphomicrobiales bacterium]
MIAFDDAYSPSRAGFLGLTEQDAVSYEAAKAVVIPFGLEASVSYGGGTGAGPRAIIAASHQVELFDEQLWCEPFREIGIVTLNEFEIATTVPEALTQLEGIVRRMLAGGKFPLVLGGEHSLTAGAIRPFAAKHPELTILHFDAHADLRDDYHGRYSHACAMRRCLDHGNVSLVSCGIRNISAEEVPFLEESGKRIRVYWAKDKARWSPGEVVSHLKGRKVYLSFDIDAFDSSLMPATGTPEPGGLFWNETIEIIAEASKICDIVGADIVELAPIQNLHACDFLAAKLAYKMLSLAFLGKTR